jgi:hypothetical protein
MIKIDGVPNNLEVEMPGPTPIVGTPGPNIELVKNEELNFETIFDKGDSIIKPVLPDNEILTPVEENIVGNENLSDDVITTVNLDDVDILKEIDDLIGYNKGENIDGIKLLDNSPILTRPVVDESLEPVMIQPEIKIETANFENVLPELINKEIRIEQMGTGYNPELFDKE